MSKSSHEKFRLFLAWNVHTIVFSSHFCFLAILVRLILVLFMVAVNRLSLHFFMSSFIICLDYVLRTSIDKIEENGFELTKKRSRRYPATTITDADNADDIAILANTPDQPETLLHSLERAAANIGLYVNAHKTEYMCYNQTGDISTLEGTPLKLVDKFTYLGSSVESTEKDIETRLVKAWTAINRLSIIWKSDLTDKMKRSFFQAAVTSILLYGCTTWTLTKRLEKKLDGNYTRMLHAILNKSWRQHPTRHQLYGHLPPITKTIQVRRARHAGHCWRSRDELIRNVLLWTPTHGRAKAGRPARTYIQQLCEDTGCCPEDLPRAMNDREEWRERVRDIRATSAIWWWWWWCYLQVVWSMNRRHLQCWRVLFLLFLTYLVSISSLGCKVLEIVIGFLFSRPFLEVLPSSTSRMVTSILRGGDFCSLFWFWVVFLFTWDTLFEKLFLSSPLPIFRSICRFSFFQVFWFFLDFVVLLLLSFVVFCFALLAWHIFLCQMPSLYPLCISSLPMLGFLILFSYLENHLMSSLYI